MFQYYCCGIYADKELLYLAAQISTGTYYFTRSQHMAERFFTIEQCLKAFDSVKKPMTKLVKYDCYPETTFFLIKKKVSNGKENK